MKRAILFVFVLVFIAGCSSAPKASPTAASTLIPWTASATVLQSATPSPALSDSSATVEPTDAEPTDEPEPDFTPSPVVKPNAAGFPPLASKKTNPGFAIGIMAVDNEKFIYYYELVDNHDALYKLDKQTNKKTKLRETPDNTLIAQLFLDTKGNLYYLCGLDATGYNSLYEYNRAQDKLIADSILEIIRADNDYIYYTVCINQDQFVKKYCLKDGSMDTVAEIQTEMLACPVRPLCFFSQGDDPASTVLYSLDLMNGTLCKLGSFGSNYSISDDGANFIVYKQTGSSTAFDVYNYASITKSTCTLPVKLTNVVATLVQSGHLFVIDSNENEKNQTISKSNIYDIDIRTNTLISAEATDFVKASSLYKDKWYLYTMVQVDKEDGWNPSLTKQKVRVFDPDTNSLTSIASLANKAYDDDQDYTFEVAGGYVWMIDYYDADGMLNECWKKITIPAAQPTASPAPSPAPSATPTIDPSTVATTIGA